MLRLGGVAPQSARPVSQNTASEISKPIYFFCLQTHKPNLNFCQILSQGRVGVRLFAKKKGSSIELEKEADNFVEFEDEFDEDIDDLEGDDNDLNIPFEKMDDWMKNKPRGFGEGKVYDTSVEDKLLEEIELIRKTQLENVDKLKIESQDAKPKIDLNASEVVSSDIRVRITNLPKKKNVHRDLKPAFQGVQGIVNISPVVFGNKKTRDPICKGFGFVDFKSSHDANRFVQMFSGQSVAFGKIQKQIKCEILKSDNGASKEPAQHGHNSSSESKLAPLEVELDHDANIEENDPNLLVLEDDELDDEDVIDYIKLLSRKQDKIPQPSIPGSAMRLKVREKAELSEVFSRSGAKEDSISKEIFVVSEDREDQDPDVDENDPDFDEDEDDDELVDEDAETENKTITPKLSLPHLLRASALVKMVKIQDPAKLVEYISRSRASMDKGDQIDNIEEDLLQYLGKDGVVEIDDKEDDIQFLSALNQGENYDIKPIMKAELDSSSSPKKIEKTKAAKKKPENKEKASNTPKPKIPGSARRLKGQERAKLENVFTKYGTKKTLVSKDM